MLIGRDAGGVSVRTYVQLFQQIIAALEVVDRLHFPGRMHRLDWAVQSTTSEDDTLVAHLAPRSVSSRRPINSVDMTAAALVNGVAVLEHTPEIPRYFDERVIDRVRMVGDRLGQHGVRSIGVSNQDRHASIDDDVRRNAREAITEASSAYSSLVGRLDVISNRRDRLRVGLLTDQSRAVICEVDRLDRRLVLDHFDKRVVVAGLLRRNALGQPVKLEAESIEVLPPQEPRASAYELLGLMADDPRSTEQVMDDVRGRRAG